MVEHPRMERIQGTQMIQLLTDGQNIQLCCNPESISTRSDIGRWKKVYTSHWSPHHCEWKSSRLYAEIASQVSILNGERWLNDLTAPNNAFIASTTSGRGATLWAHSRTPTIWSQIYLKRANRELGIDTHELDILFLDVAPAPALALLTSWSEAADLYHCLRSWLFFQIRSRAKA